VTHDKTIRAVIRYIGLIALLSAAIIGTLALQKKDVPEALLAVATTSLGALTSMLVSTSGRGAPNDPVPVVVNQPPTDPVPVETAPAVGD